MHSYVFSQILAGPEANRITRLMMQLIVYVTFAVLPIVTLLYFQIKFLPFQRTGAEVGHRLIQAELAPHIDQHAGKSGAQVGNDLADEGFDLARRGRWCKLGHDPVPLRSHGTAGSGRILCRLR